MHRTKAIPQHGPSLPLANWRENGSLPKLWNGYQVEAWPIEGLHASSRQVRRHGERQLAKLGASIDRFSFLLPALAKPDGELISGVARVEAARRLDMKFVPVICITHLSDVEIRAFRLADNRIAELAEWEPEALALELRDLTDIDLDFSIELTGFDTAEVDIRIGSLSAMQSASSDLADEPVALPARPVSRPGDIWRLGEHRLICGNALEAATYDALMGGELARMAISDPPFNIPVNGMVSGLGKARHDEFAMASGEMSEAEFIRFLTKIFDLNKGRLMPGALAYFFIDWRHCFEMTTAQRAAGFDLINVCVWSKTNGGMGSLYRSAHEFVFVFGEKGVPYVNNVQLGRFGRYRKNVWEYAGANTFRKGRDQDLADHPTIKSTEMIADAIRDVSHRGDIILDPFVGSGTTILAAERTGRRARAIEIEAKYVDVAIRRWSAMTGQAAVLTSTSQPFEDIARERGMASANDGDPPSIRIRHRTRTSPIALPAEG